MTKILYPTGNDVKFRQAQDVCNKFGIEFEQASLGVPEIQGEDGEPIARDKAEKAFAVFKRPVVISDDNWVIPGLKGFPGAYMKSVNDWFTPADWINLTKNLKDRRIILRQIVVYQDDKEQQLFSVDLVGVLLKEPRGQSRYPHATVTSFDGGKQSDAEYHARGESIAKGERTSWHDFAEWYKKNYF